MAEADATVSALVISGTGDGTIKKGLIETAQGQVNIYQTVITPIIAILIRFCKTFAVSLSGSLAGGGVTGAIPSNLLKSSIIIALSIAGVDAIKNFATLFGGLETKFPLLGV